MTDNEIIKALESIASASIGDCQRDCAFYDGKVHFCGGIVAKHSLDIINRQKAEIARYEKTVGKLAINKDGIVTGMLNGKETEYTQKSVADIFRNMAVKRARSEAIKEFAERLLDEYDLWTESDVIEYCYVAEVVYNLVEEMTE